MHQYLNLLRDALENGVDRSDRTGVGTRSVFGRQLRFNLSEGFPAVTTKRLAFKSMLAELLWFLRGSSNVNELKRLNCNIWDPNVEAEYWRPHATSDGDAGCIYGVHWRHWSNSKGGEIDQLDRVITQIKEKPDSRRLIVTAWDPSKLDYEEQEVPQVALSPCHIMFQFYVANDKLSLQLYQRSADLFLGVPFNVASYSLMLHIISAITDLTPGEFIHTIGDAHIYRNHFEQVREQLKREPYELPKIHIDRKFNEMESIQDLDKYIHQMLNEASQIWASENGNARSAVYKLLEEVAYLEGYRCHSAIKATMAV